MNVTHAALPWFLPDSDNSIRTTSNEMVVSTFGSDFDLETDRVNAAFIVKAVNLHYQLVEALRLAQNVYDVGIFNAAETDLLTRMNEARKLALAAAGEPV